jgi:hypothetical protein
MHPELQKKEEHKRDLNRKRSVTLFFGISFLKSSGNDYFQEKNYT